MRPLFAIPLLFLLAFILAAMQAHREHKEYLRGWDECMVAYKIKPKVTGTVKWQ